MTPDAPPGTRLRKPGRFVEGNGIGHQGGGGQNSTLVGFHNGAIDPRRKPEVVPVDD